MSTLTPEEIQRYARHLVLPDIGGAGQQKLKAARVLVIGAGGLGSPVLLYLAAAGVGHLRVVDDDDVSASNLQRQVLHASDRVGIAKTESAAAALKALNPEVEVETVHARFSQENAQDLLKGCTIATDGSDNFPTRYALADACEAAHIPLVTAAVGQFDGSITTFKPYEAGNPGYRDIFPEVSSQQDLPSCEEAGVLGALTGVMGSMQALEVIKEICGFGDSLVGRLVLYDAKACRWQQISYARPI